MMTYLPADVPLPEADPWERPFWSHCEQRSLRFQCCSECGKIRHPPLPVCACCGSSADHWVPATDDAEIYTFTVVHLASHPALAPALPFNAVVVIFPALQSVRLVSNVVRCPNEDLRIGMPLKLVWEEPKPGHVLPRFEPRTR